MPHPGGGFGKVSYITPKKKPKKKGPGAGAVNQAKALGNSLKMS